MLITEAHQLPLSVQTQQPWSIPPWPFMLLFRISECILHRYGSFQRREKDFWPEWRLIKKELTLMMSILKWSHSCSCGTTNANRYLIVPSYYTSYYKVRWLRVVTTKRKCRSFFKFCCEFSRQLSKQERKLSEVSGISQRPIVKSNRITTPFQSPTLYQFLTAKLLRKRSIFESKVSTQQVGPLKPLLPRTRTRQKSLFNDSPNSCLMTT